MSKYQKQSFIYLIFISLITLLVYYPGLYSKFYLDDLLGIVNSDYVSAENLAGVYDLEGPKRIVGKVSFFINKLFITGEPVGYRAVNVAIHIFNGVGVYWLTLLVGQRLIPSHSSINIRYIAIISTTLFLLHPLQTQAVTYIVQRYTSLMTLFYLATIISYLKYREQRSVITLVLVPVFALLAVFTKEVALTLLPLLLVLEWLYFKNIKPLMLSLSLFAFSAILVGILQYFHFVDLSYLDAITRDDFNVNRLDYFKAQSFVITKYFVSYFILNNYHLEYSDSVKSILSANNWLVYFLGHVLVILTSVKFYKRFPFIVLCVAGYYITQLVESTFIPIRDVIVEHRTYLPNIFLSMLIAMIILKGIGYFSIKVRTWLFSLCMVLIISLLSVYTYARNQLWADQVAFYRYELGHSPNHWRIKNALATLYIEKGDNQKAASLIKSIFSSQPDDFYPPVLLNGILIFQRQEPIFAEALERILFKRINSLSKPNKAKAFYYRANRLYRQHKLISAKAHLEQALRLYSEFPEAMYKLAEVEFQLGEYDVALELINKLDGKIKEVELLEEFKVRINQARHL